MTVISKLFRSDSGFTSPYFLVDVSGNLITQTLTVAGNRIELVSGAKITTAGQTLLSQTTLGSSVVNILGTLTGLTISGPLSNTGTTNLGLISNVTIAGGTAGQVLTTDGNGVLSWATVSGSGGTTINGSTTLSGLTDVNITSPSDGQVLKYSTSQGKWIPSADLVGNAVSGIQLTALSVSTATASGSGGLSYNNLSGVFTFTPPVIPLFTGGTVSGSTTFSSSVTFNSSAIFSSAITFSAGATFSGALSFGNAVTFNSQTTFTGSTNLGPVGNLSITGGTAGQVLTTNGSGSLSWVTQTVTVVAASRTSVSVTTSSIAAGSSANYTITGYKGYMLYSIQTSYGAWVTVYSSTAARTSDASRAITTDPTPGSGVIAEMISTTGTTQYFSPAIVGYSSEATPTTSIPLKIYNNGASASVITVTLTILQTES